MVWSSLSLKICELIAFAEREREREGRRLWGFDGGHRSLAASHLCFRHISAYTLSSVCHTSVSNNLIYSLSDLKSE